MLPTVEKLLVISHVPHFLHDSRIFAYGPYVREMDIWADLFTELIVAAPCQLGPPPSDCLAFTRKNVRVAPQRQIDGITVKARIRQFLLLPSLLFDLSKAMWQAEAIHVRCPGSLGLLGAILAPLFSKRLIAKYSNQWTCFPGESWTWKLQRFILRSRWWHGPVTVYAEQTQRAGNVYPFFTSIMTEDQMLRAKMVATKRKSSSDPLRVLYVGRLTASKNVLCLLKGVGIAAHDGLPVQASIIGDGPSRGQLEQFCSDHHLDSMVRFTGAIPYEEVLTYFEKADVVVLTSDSEGWGKSMAEGMAFGLIGIGSEGTGVAALLENGRGFTIARGDHTALAHILKVIGSDPDHCRGMRERAAQWAQQLTLERLRQAIADLLTAEWGVSLKQPRSLSDMESDSVPVAGASVGSREKSGFMAGQQI